jgi:hypothetical protein
MLVCVVVHGVTVLLLQTQQALSEHHNRKVQLKEKTADDMSEDEE